MQAEFCPYEKFSSSLDKLQKRSYIGNELNDNRFLFLGSLYSRLRGSYLPKNDVVSAQRAVSIDHKEKIVLYASQRLFVEGFSRISVDELTSELSMSKKTFYQIFRSKEDLVEEIVQRRFESVNSAMEKIFSQDVDAVTKLHKMVRFLAGMLSGISKPAMMDMHRHYPHLWERMQQFRRERLTRNLSMILEQGIAEGQIRTDVSKQIFILAYLSSVEGIIQPEVLAHESFSSREAIEEIVNIFFGGILTEPARLRLRELSQSSIK